MKTTITLSQDRRCRGRVSNRAPPVYQSGMLPLLQLFGDKVLRNRISVNSFFIIYFHFAQCYFPLQLKLIVD
jgi:hypothetical protein